MGLPLASYSWTGFRRDLLAGLTVATIAVPQAMAYALIAGIDPEIGLYTAIVMTALASIFGSSSHLINGPTNAISLVVFSALAHTASPDSMTDALEATFTLTLMVGTVQVLIAIFKLGDLTRYISESVVLGFMTGAGFLVAITQIGNLFGLEERGTGHQHILVRLWLTITAGGPANFRAFGIGMATIVLVTVLRRVARKYKLPRADMLMVVVLIAVFVAVMGWEQPGPDGKPLVAVVGHVPRALPPFHVPEIRYRWVETMAGSALAISLLGLLEALAIAKSIASRTREPLDYNRQCLAEGVANLGGAFFKCMPGSGSLTRSSINFQAGAVSRWSGVFAAMAVALIVVALAPLARYIPKAALAGLLFVTAAGLIDWHRVRFAMRASRYDRGLVLATAGAAIFISIEFSIIIGTFLSFLFFIPRAAQLTMTELVVGSERTIRERLPDDPRCGKMAIFDLEGELFFGSAPELDGFFEDLKRRTDEGVRIVILRLKRTRNPDMVCLEHFHHFLQLMLKRGATVLLCGVRDDFARGMRNVHLDDIVPEDRVFRELGASGSSTLRAVRRAYDLLGQDMCSTCPKREEKEGRKGDWHYTI